MFSASSKPKLAWNWIESLLLGLLALVGVDIALSLLIGLGVGVTTELTGNPVLANFLETESITANFGFYVLSRLTGLGLISWFIHRRGLSLKDLGFTGFRPWKSLKAVAIASGLLLVVTGAAFYVLERAAPSLNLDQEQEIVFESASGNLEIALAFLALVVIAPLVEEVIFRGFMLPAFSKRFGFAAAAVVTSVLFGAVHWQLNVGIITFVMGLLLAWIVKRTASLWPAIMFHSLKNLVAFIFIFG